MQDMLSIAAASGVHCLQVPTPFAVGNVNAYLIEDDPLTLIDSGPASTRSLDSIERRLRTLGHSLADLGLLVVTHQHVDHLGLTSYLARVSGPRSLAWTALFHTLVRSTSVRPQTMTSRQT
jgi:glyoxylase-like metal-dependent hydrolase (beta-lactamase superfamily II)